MADNPTYCVYILTNTHNRVLYTGVTRDLARRMYEHQHHLVPGFTARYNATKLVYFECGTDISAAIQREKQIKSGSRSRKISLIESVNPEWRDLTPFIEG